MKFLGLLFLVFQLVSCQEKKQIRIAFDDGFWGTRVSVFTVNDKILMKNDTLITDETVGNADSFICVFDSDVLLIKAEMFHFKQGFSEYYYKINIKNNKVLRFYMGVNRKTCERELKWELLKEDYSYY